MTNTNRPERRLLGGFANISYERISQQVFIVVSTLLFVASTAATILWCGSMAGMNEIAMAGGWVLTTAWVRAPEQTWLAFAASFLAMWMIMMMAMMSPSLIPMLWRYRRLVSGASRERLGRLTLQVGGGYFFVWAVIGMVVLPMGIVLTTLVMRYPALARVVPIMQGVVILLAGMLQFTVWKARRLACCREMFGCGRTLSMNVGLAWRYGLHLGFHCCRYCFSLMAISLVMGVMDLRAMGVVTVAISAERLVPDGEYITHAIGGIAAGVGMFLIVRAVGIG